MDKSWMRAPRWSVEYDEGLCNFIELAFSTSAKQNKILCPCGNCGNNYWLEAKDVRDHLISVGFMDGYTSWILHGEGLWSSVPNMSSSSQSQEDHARGDAMDQMLMEGFGMYDAGALGVDEECEDELDVDAEAYYKLVSDGSQQLYACCKRFSKLQFLVRLLHLKNLWGISNGCFDDLLSLIKEIQNDGYPLADCVEVLVSVVFNQTTILPRAHGKIQNLGSATARCIAWPRKNVCSAHLTGSVGKERSTSKSEASKFNNVGGASQVMAENKLARKVSKEKTTS